LRFSPPWSFVTVVAVVGLELLEEGSGRPVMDKPVGRSWDRTFGVSMHINTLVHQALKAAGAWPAFTDLPWKTRQQVLETVYTLAQRVLIEEDGLAERAGQEITQLTGSPLVGEAGARSLRKWVAGRVGSS
jgi:hypothetical protein